MGDFLKHKRKICAALMLISFMPQYATVKGANDEILTGSCYESTFFSETEHCVWTLNKSDGTLIFENPELFAVGHIKSGLDDTQKELVKYGIIANGTKGILNFPFRDFPNLKNISLPDTVTEVRGFVSKCPQIEELTLSHDIKFRRLCHTCNGLKTINLGPLVSSFKDSSDWDLHSNAPQCPNLISVNVDEGNESFKSVNGALLSKDGNVLNVYPFGRRAKAVISNGVETTLKGTFVDCPFTDITIPETVKTIHDAFDGCNNLSTINFFGTQEPEKSSDYNFCGSEVINVPHDYNGTTFWGYPVQKVIDHHGYLKDDCTCWMTQDGDTQMTIGGEGDLDSSLLADDGSTWKNVKDKIKKVNIDEGITTIDMSVFSNCENLSEVSLPRSVKNVTSLSECLNLAYIIVPEDNENYSAVDGVLFSKNGTELIHYPAGKSSSSYKIPEGTTTICSDAFSDCKNLQEVTLPESIDRVEANAFSENSSLETVNYMGKEPPNYDFTFKNPPIVQVWTDYNGDELFGVNVSKVFEKGNHDGFSWVFAPESTLTIKGTGIIERYNPLGKFKKLSKRLVIEDGITSIDTEAFYGYDFTDVKLPSTLETIGRNAFGGCKCLNSITLPTSLKTLGEHAFDGCYGLTEICVEDGNNAYYDVDGVLFSKLDLALIQYPPGKGGNYTVPENVTSINNLAFCNTNIESVTIKGSLQSIGRNAFYGCHDLKSVYIDGEVDRVDDYAFAFCEQLSEVEYKGQERPESGENVFFGCDKLNTTTL